MSVYPRNCARCNVDLSTTSSIMSRFSTETICSLCERRERVHAQYQEAHDRELEQVMAGNMNYRGIGTPPELYQPVTPAEKLAMAINGKPFSDVLAITKVWGADLEDRDTAHMQVRFPDGSSVSISKTSPFKAVVAVAGTS